MYRFKKLSNLKVDFEKTTPRSSKTHSHKSKIKIASTLTKKKQYITFKVTVTK